MVGEESVGFTSVLSLDLENLGIDPARVHVVWSLSKVLGASGIKCVRVPVRLTLDQTHEPLEQS